MRSVTNEKGMEKNMENKAVLFELNIEKMIDVSFRIQY